MDNHCEICAGDEPAVEYYSKKAGYDICETCFTELFIAPEQEALYNWQYEERY